MGLKPDLSKALWGQTWDDGFPAPASAFLPSVLPSRQVEPVLGDDFNTNRIVARMPLAT